MNLHSLTGQITSAGDDRLVEHACCTSLLSAQLAPCHKLPQQNRASNNPFEQCIVWGSVSEELREG